MAQGTPIYPFENPADASYMIMFGIVYLTLVTLSVGWAKEKKIQGTDFYFDRSTWLLKTSVISSEEKNKQLPRFFWPVVMIFIRICQIAGVAVICTGLLGLHSSLSK